MQTPTQPHPTLDGVRAVLVSVLGIEDRADAIGADTGLLGELPELDSLAVLELAAALEDRFGIVVDDTDFTGDVFATVGTLAAFVEGEVAASR